MTKGILVRLFTYPFCVFFLYIGIQMIFDTPNYKYEFLKFKAVFYGFIGIIIVVIYLITDIIILFKQKFRT